MKDAAGGTGFTKGGELVGIPVDGGITAELIAMQSIEGSEIVLICGQ